ncbi:MAG: hypothetical protein ACR2H1_11420 [Limisphaerales bacterium]
MKTVVEMVCDDWAFFVVCFNGVPIPGLELCDESVSIRALQSAMRSLYAGPIPGLVLEGVPVVNMSHVRLN